MIRRRNLPHWELTGAAYFITFRLHKDAHAEAPLSLAERLYVQETAALLHAEYWVVHLLTVMPDHVHLLATPLEQSPGECYSLSFILRRITGQTAREINRWRGRTGPFWQVESYDRIVRNTYEFDEKARYILNNAVKAGLAEDGWQYLGFWCHPDIADFR